MGKIIYRDDWIKLDSIKKRLVENAKSGWTVMAMACVDVPTIGPRMYAFSAREVEEQKATESAQPAAEQAEVLTDPEVVTTRPSDPDAYLY